MANPRTLLRSFAGGEISPLMYARVDDARFQSGAALVRNMITKPQGPAFRRPGFAFVNETHDSNVVRLFPFKYSTDQTFAIELGTATVDARVIGYTRFHHDGATLLYAEPRAYVAPQNFSTFTGSYNSHTAYVNGVDTTDNVIRTAAAHGLATGDPILFIKTVGGAVFPTESVTSAPLVESHTYYAITGGSLATDEIKVASTAALALAGTALDLTAAGSGTSGQRKVHYGYEVGDLAAWTGAGPGTFYLMAAHPELASSGVGAPPTDTDYWYREPAVNDEAEGIYEVPHGYLESDLFDINFEQLFDVMTFVHPLRRPYELRRVSATRWIWSPVTLAPTLAAPTSVVGSAYRGLGFTVSSIILGTPAVFQLFSRHSLSDTDAVYLAGVAGSGAVTANFPDGLYQVTATSSSPALTPNQLILKHPETGVQIDAASGTYSGGGLIWPTSLSSEISNQYVVTAVASDGTESVQSAAVTVANNLFAVGAYNTISWNAVTGASRYRVYKKESGLYGYIGEVDAVEATSFKDDNIGPDLGTTPPLLDISLSGTDYPAAVCHFEQRRCFAGTPLQPDALWMTRSATESDLTYKLPTEDDDRVYARIPGASTIRHLVPVSHLVMLTSEGEFRISPVNSDAITPSSISARAPTYVGSSGVRPEVVNNIIVFCAGRGGHVRELGYSQANNDYATGDLSIRAGHLFDGLSIVQMAQQKSPLPVLWFVSSDGKLLGLTYVPEESIGSWHQHDTDGTFESVCCVSEGDEDHLYVVVRRTIGGVTKRYIERSTDQRFGDLEDSFFVDSGITYTGGAATSIPGLGHLIGKKVAVLADGLVVAQKTVSASGTITLTTAASKVQAGLPVTAELQTLPMALQIDGAFGTGRPKNVNKAWCRVVDSGDFYVGPLGGTLVRAGLDAGELSSESVEVVVPGRWGEDGQVHIRQADPLPLTVVGLSLEVAVGG